jgi:hypothetical protein
LFESAFRKELKMRKLRFVPLALVLLALVATQVGAQGVSYDNPWNTSYQVVNLGTEDALITVDYYKPDGTTEAGAQRQFSDVPPGGSVTVLQATEGSLPSGTYSAVISADQPIAAVANQQTDPGTGNSQPPFSSYSGASAGSNEVIIPAVMHNWFGYYTEFYIQNVGTADATDVDIEYLPTTFAGCTVGSSGTDNDNAINQYAGMNVTQLNATTLGASGLTGACDPFNGRFLGSAKITADQPLVVVANQHTQGKLFTYNAQSGGAENVLLPAYMRNYYGYYAALVIANPGTISAGVTVTYTNGGLANSPAGQSVVTANHTVPAGESITIYDGPTGSDTDLADAGYAYGGPYSFFGTVTLDSDQPVVAMVNQEAVTASGAQAGTYNGVFASEGSQRISVPLIQSDFYGYYTSLTIMTVDGSEADVNITYTSDDTYSAVTGQSKTYPHSTTDGFLNRYEGSSASGAQSDILDDVAWADGSGNRQFIGSAVIEVTSGSDIIAFVNSEKKVSGIDSMYTYNAFNLQ